MPTKRPRRHRSKLKKTKRMQAQKVLNKKDFEEKVKDELGFNIFNIEAIRTSKAKSTKLHDYLRALYAKTVEKRYPDWDKEFESVDDLKKFSKKCHEIAIKIKEESPEITSEANSFYSYNMPHFLFRFIGHDLSFAVERITPEFIAIRDATRLQIVNYGESANQYFFDYELEWRTYKLLLDLAQITNPEADLKTTIEEVDEDELLPEEEEVEKEEEEIPETKKEERIRKKLQKAGDKAGRLLSVDDITEVGLE